MIEDLVKAGLYRDFDEALAKARSLMADSAMTDEELDVVIERAAEQALIGYALEEVMTPAALADLGFTPATKGLSTLKWSGVCRGVELHVVAGPDMFGLWTLAGRCVTRDQWMWDEHRLQGQEPRGKVALTVLGMWRTAFGREAPVPAKLDLGLHYERHLIDMRATNLGLPTLQVDGEVLRATRRWLAQHFGPWQDEVGPLPDQDLHLSFRDGLLRLAVGDRAYGCPARGTWVGDCTVSLRAFLAAPPWLLRGGWVRLERALDRISIGWFSLPVTEVPPAKGGISGQPRPVG